MYPDWITYIDIRRRKTALEVLQTLSQLQNKDSIDFIIIGAISLLVKGYLQYTVYWDVDLLFRNEHALQAFIAMPKPEHLRIIDYDESLMINKDIASLHTAWSFDRVWFNVDYILRKDIFNFYTHNIKNVQAHTEQVQFDNTRYNISVLMAHPWDIVIEKVVSPRTARDIELRVDASVDIRHIFAVCRAENQNDTFWHYLFDHAPYLCDKKLFKDKLLQIFQSAPELGYHDVKIPQKVMKQLRNK